MKEIFNFTFVIVFFVEVGIDLIDFQGIDNAPIFSKALKQIILTYIRGYII